MGELVATQVLTNTSVPALRGIQDPIVKLVSGPAGARAWFVFCTLSFKKISAPKDS